MTARWGWMPNPERLPRHFRRQAQTVTRPPAPLPSPEEQAVIDRFEAAEAAPESWQR